MRSFSLLAPLIRVSGSTLLSRDAALRASPLLLGLAAGTPAQAEEPRRDLEPAVLSDTAVDLLDVADAFDEDDPFDINLRLSFDHYSRNAKIRRESSISQPGLTTGGYTSAGLDVARYTESTQRMIPEIEIGLMRDLALTIKMPVILANNQRLGDLNGSAAQSDITTQGLVGESLFQVPFESPTRSGIEYLAFGLDMAVMNQFRNPALPNWVIGIETRFNVSEPMHACNENPADGQVECAYPADINRNGEVDELGADFGSIANDAEGDFPSGGRKPGVSRGTTGIEAHAYVSKRIKYIEPYTGISALIEFPVGKSDYGAVDLQGSLVNHPPVRGTVTAGMAVIPWEQVEKFQRLSFDFRVKGTYVSEGRDYSELFDALGSSPAASLRNPNFAQYTGNLDANGEVDANYPSVVDPNSDKIYFTGLTDVQQHGVYDLSASMTWRAGRYVQFDLGGAARIVQGHLITMDQPCNPNFSGPPTESGPCKSQVGNDSDGNPMWSADGLPNANHRKVINATGSRFFVETSVGLSGWLRASVLF